MWEAEEEEEEEVEPASQLEIIEVFTVPSTSTTRPRPRVRTTFRPRAPTLAPLTLGRISSTTEKRFHMHNSMDSLLEVSTKKHPTNADDIVSFFGNVPEDQFEQEAPGADKLLRSQSINQERDHDDSAPAGVLGLFEKMKKMHSKAASNFDVVQLPTQEQAERRFQQMQEELRLRQVA